MQGQTEYKEVKTMQFPNMIARIYIPNLTDEERNARMKIIHKEAANLLKKVK